MIRICDTVHAIEILNLQSVCNTYLRSLPSEERMVVIARGRKATSGSSEFAIMLHDNSEFALSFSP